MRPKTVSKITAVLAVLLLVLSGIMALQLGVRADERKTGSVEGIISTPDGSSLPKGLEVNLKDHSEDDILTTYTLDGGYFLFDDVDVGYYSVLLPSQSHKEQHVYFNNESEILLVEDQKSTYLEMEVERTRMDLTLDGAVLDIDTDEPVEGTEITIEDMEKPYSTTVGLYNETTGEYRIPIYEGNFTITVTAPDYPPIVQQNWIRDGETTQDFTLSDTPESPLVTGYVWSDEGAVSNETRVTLYNETIGAFHTSVDSGPYFEIGVVEGNYTLVVDSVGYLPYHKEGLEVEAGEQLNLGRIFVEESEKETIETNIDMTDVQNVTIVRNRTYQPDTRIKGLDYSYLGNMLMQIDLTIGNNDMVLDYSELQEFKEFMEYRESRILSTQRLVNFDGVPYKLNETIDWSMKIDGLEEPGDSISVLNTSVEINSYSEVRYEPYSEVELKTTHELDLYLNYDFTFGTYRDLKYLLKLPEGYERTSTHEEVEITGFTEVHIDPGVGDGKVNVPLEITLSEAGDADIVLEVGPEVHMEEEDYYIVKQGSKVTCIADFTDPVGNEEDAIYEWYVDDEGIGEGETIDYIFNNTGEKVLNVVITETGGHITEANITVLVDGTPPQGNIEGDLVVEEEEEFQLSAYNFTDEGVIGRYEWNFSDDSSIKTGMNVTHTYELYGNYNVTLNITDVVGNWEIYTVEIEVLDATSPVAKFNLTYQDDDEEKVINSDDLTGLSIPEGVSVTLDADPSHDPTGFEGERGEVETFTWWIEKDDFKSENEAIYDYDFESFGTYVITLNVTDEYGNYHNTSREFEVSMGPRPNLEITNLEFSQTPLRDGQTVTVTVNVTNYGTANATDLEIFFRVDDDDVSFETFTVYKDDEETDRTIPVDETRQVKIEWTIADSGRKTIEVNITDSNEPSEWLTDNVITREVNIEPPAWRRYIVYIIIPVVIVGVAFGLYYYKDKFQR